MITLSSDFGSPYPAAMKGVILDRCDARLVDVAHDFPRQDVRSSAFWLREVLPYFPPAVHLVVVDPGVGTDRNAIVIRAGGHAIVAPDNGVAIPVARELAGADEFEVFRIDVTDPESSTFHGRDVFAPAAAEVYEAGIGQFHARATFEKMADYEEITFPEPRVIGQETRGEVLVVDDFGNVISNIPGEFLQVDFGETIEVNGMETPVRKTYATLEPGEPLVTVGSHGYVEFAVNQGSGDEAFGLEVGDEICLY
jgi:hypothetical protein